MTFLRRNAIFLFIAVVVLIAGGFAGVRFLTVAPKTAVDATTLTIIAGTAAVQPGRDAQFQPGADGMTLKAGDRVRTDPDSYAVITFFDGSTAELEPETEVAITSLLRGRSSRPSASAVAYRQVSGTTWNAVVQLVDPSSVYQIDTPAASFGVRGTLLQLSVDAGTGQTVARSHQGSVTARAQGTEVVLLPFTQVVAQVNQPPAPPAAFTPASDRLIFTVDTPIWARVIDPVGRTAGTVSPGLLLNQMPGSVATVPVRKPGIIEIPVYYSGEYTIVLEGNDRGAYQFIVQGISEDQPVFTQGVQGNIKPGQRFIAKLSVSVRSGKMTRGQLGSFVTLWEEGPGRFVRTSWAVGNASLPAAAAFAEGTPTPAATRTSAPATATPAPEPTETPASLPTEVVAPPTATATPVIATPTPTPAATRPPSATATPTRTSVPTPSPSPAASPTPAAPAIPR